MTPFTRQPFTHRLVAFVREADPVDVRLFVGGGVFTLVTLAWVWLFGWAVHAFVFR